jgi:hypothetical protein
MDGDAVTAPAATCTACGQRPVCALAEAVILVVARDYRGVVTRLCRACGAGEDADDAKAVERVSTETKVKT